MGVVETGISLGSKTILGGMALAMISFFSTWIFNTVEENKTVSVENRAMFKPLLRAVEKLTVTTQKMNIDADMRNLDMLDALNIISVKMENHEIRLRNVTLDCEENHKSIEKCKSMHYTRGGKVYERNDKMD